MTTVNVQVLVFCGLLLAVPAVADQAHLAGTWKGSAQKSVCGQPAGSEELILVLRDKGYEPGPGVPFGDVSGDLVVGSGRDGILTLKYDAKTGKAASFIGSVKRDDGLSASKNSPFSTYWTELQAGDPWAGVGLYQSLTGTLTRRNLTCLKLGDQGEVLTVKLTKQ